MDPIRICRCAELTHTGSEEDPEQQPWKESLHELWKLSSTTTSSTVVVIVPESLLVGACTYASPTNAYS